MSCPDCGGVVVMQEGCELCINCGWNGCYCGDAFSQDSWGESGQAAPTS